MYKKNVDTIQLNKVFSFGISVNEGHKCYILKSNFLNKYGIPGNKIPGNRNLLKMYKEIPRILFHYIKRHYKDAKNIYLI